MKKEKKKKIENVKGEKQGVVFIGRACFDLIIAAAGIMAKMGHCLYVIDACHTGELFQTLADYGGRTDKVITFRQVDYILCSSLEDLTVFLSLNHKEISTDNIWIYIDPESFWQARKQYIGYKKIVLAHSFSYLLKEIITLAKKENFQAELFILRGLPGKKINFSYFCRIYQKEFGVFQKILELPWAEEDLEYRVRMGYEPSQGFFKLSDGYHRAIEHICIEAGEHKIAEIRKMFRVFEKRNVKKGG